jgi:hypothetical protein
MNYKIIKLRNNDERWMPSLLRGLELSDHIEFNVLYRFPGKPLKILLEDLEGEIISPVPNTRFYFNHKRRISIPISPKSRKFILSRSFEEWAGYILEDPSLIVENYEILGSITHEMICQIDTKVLSFPND